MFPDYSKFHIVNNTGQTLPFQTTGTNNFVITGKPWKFDSSGVLTYGSEVTLFADNDTSLANAAALEGAEFNNTTNKWLGMFCIAKLVTSAVATAQGGVDIYWEWSTDGAAGTYPSDAAEWVIAEDLVRIRRVQTKATNETRSVNFRI
jgi:hypothetical protein